MFRRSSPPFTSPVSCVGVAADGGAHGGPGWLESSVFRCTPRELHLRGGPGGLAAAGLLMQDDSFYLMGLQNVTLIKTHRFNYRANIC